jgi:hypothetical protein
MMNKEIGSSKSVSKIRGMLSLWPIGALGRAKWDPLEIWEKMFSQKIFLDKH